MVRRDEVHKEVPIVITSVGSPAPVIEPLHQAGTFVFADVASLAHARKAVDAGADGLVLLSAGAGGHTGWANPFAFVRAVRGFFDGPLAVAGGMSDGYALWGAVAAGFDLGMFGTRFIASAEANAADAYKQMLVDSRAEDIVYTNLFTGVHGNYLRGSIERAGLDPANLPESDPSKMNFGGGAAAKAWKDIWGCGQGIGAVKSVVPAAELIDRLYREYEEARERLNLAHH